MFPPNILMWKRRCDVRVGATYALSATYPLNLRPATSRLWPAFGQRSSSFPSVLSSKRFIWSTAPVTARSTVAA